MEDEVRPNPSHWPSRDIPIAAGQANLGPQTERQTRHLLYRQRSCAYRFSQSVLPSFSFVESDSVMSWLGLRKQLPSMVRQSKFLFQYCGRTLPHGKAEGGRRHHCPAYLPQGAPSRCDFKLGHFSDLNDPLWVGPRLTHHICACAKSLLHMSGEPSASM